MAINLKASNHAEQRIKERLFAKNKEDVKRIVQKSYKEGLKFSKHYIPKKTLNWIDYKVNQKYFGRCNWRIYKDCLFLYSKSLTVVTVIPIPEHLKIKKNKKDLIKGFTNINK